ncbi:hypothetical protein [Granulicoccus sp. GXG6511]|uniref:hypothetical protein n=1 Tax=Granulicoccus sp. GXG6511 TaxID=3381351 RepID=UPI003D7CBED4
MSGRMVGSLVAAIFGAIFVVVNSGGLPPVARIILCIAAVAVPAIVLVRAVLESRESREPQGREERAYAGPTRELGRWFWPTVAIEVVALFGGLMLLNSFTSIGWAGVAWVALVVGLHFIPFAINTKLRRFWMLTVVLSAAGAAGLILAARGSSPDVVGIVAGVISGIALLGAALYGALRSPSHEAAPAPVAS